ncbi:hypothetical protein, partial [Niallia endozanthoxylica]
EEEVEAEVKSDPEMEAAPEEEADPEMEAAPEEEAESEKEVELEEKADPEMEAESEEKSESKLETEPEEETESEVKAGNSNKQMIENLFNYFVNKDSAQIMDMVKLINISGNSEVNLQLQLDVTPIAFAMIFSLYAEKKLSSEGLDVAIKKLKELKPD